MHHEGLLEAKKYFGTLENIAHALGVTPQRLNNWLNYKNKMPIRYAVKLIKITQGKISFPSLIPYLDPEDKELGKELMLAESVKHLDKVLIRNLTISKQVAVGIEIEHEIGDRRGRPSTKKCQKSDTFKQRTDVIVAKQAGFSSRYSYRAAKRVVEEGISELIILMDKEEISITVAAAIAAFPQQVQHTLFTGDAKTLVKRAKALLKQCKPSSGRISQNRHPVHQYPLLVEKRGSHK